MDLAAPPPVRPWRSWPQRLVIAVGIVVSASLLLGASAIGWGYWKLSHITRVNVELPPAATGAPQNYLIVGSDSRASGDPNDPGALGRADAMGQRSDTIMVLRVDPADQAASLLSLPRDLWVPIAGRPGHERINAAYSMGKQVLVDTIQQDFGIAINHYVEMDFRGFQGLVGAIDGVPMWFDQPMRDRNSGLLVNNAGCTKLDGPSALAFARSRHLEFFEGGRWRSDGTGDLGRISRQQLFIRRAVKRAVGKGLDDPFTLKSLVEIGTRNISVDKNLSARALLSLGRRFQKFDSSTLRTFTLPASGFRTSGGASVLQLDEAASQPLLNIFRGRPLDALTESVVHVAVMNSSGRSGQAADVAAALVQAGFGVDRWANGSEVGHPLERRTTIRYAPGAQAAADLLARHLTVGAELAEDAALPAGKVQLLVGTDFSTVEAQARAHDDASITTAPPVTVRRSGSSAGRSRSTTTTTSVPPASVGTTTTTVIGRVPGEPPAAAHCG